MAGKRQRAATAHSSPARSSRHHLSAPRRKYVLVSVMAASADPLLSAGVLQLVSTDRSPDREHVARGRGGIIQFHPRTRSRPSRALCFIFPGLLGGHAMDRGRTSGTYARLYGPQPLISFVCYLWTTITLARYDSFAVGFSYTRVHSIDIFYFDTYLLQQVGLIHRRFMHNPRTLYDRAYKPCRSIHRLRHRASAAFKSKTSSSKSHCRRAWEGPMGVVWGWGNRLNLAMGRDPGPGNNLNEGR